MFIWSRLHLCQQNPIKRSTYKWKMTLLAWKGRISEGPKGPKGCHVCIYIYIYILIIIHNIHPLPLILRAVGFVGASKSIGLKVSPGQL